MLIGTIAVIIIFLALSILQLQRWRAAHLAAHQHREDVYFIPAAIVYPLIAMLALGSIALICLGTRQSNSPYDWAYFLSAVLCAGLCLAVSAETRRTFVKFVGDELIVRSLMRARRVRISDIERVLLMRGVIVIRLRCGRVMLASNVLGWNPALRARLSLLGKTREAAR